MNLKAVKNLRRKTHSTKITTPEEKSTTESTGSPAHTEPKRKFSEMSSDESEEETLQKKIERLAMEDSADDMDFNPADCSTESSSETEEDLEVSLTELQNVKEEAMSFLNNDEPSDALLQENREESDEKRSTQEIDESAEPANRQLHDSVGFEPLLKLSQDGDTTYYSPISSKSVSPEPSMSHSTERDLFEGKEKSTNFINGEIKCNLDIKKSGRDAKGRSRQRGGAGKA